MKLSVGFKLSVGVLAIVAAVVLVFVPQTSIFYRAFRVEVAERPEPDFGPMHYLRLVKELGHCGAYYGTLREIPREMITARVCLEGIKQCDLPETIRRCPVESITHEVALYAAKNRHLDLRDIPEAVLDAEVTMTYAMSGGLLLWVPERLQTRELYLASITAVPQNFKWVPKEEIDSELAWVAVKAEPSLLALVPLPLITSSLAHEAVSRDWRALEHVPGALMSDSLYKIALRQDGLALAYVPFEDRSLELCRLALSKTNASWEFVPHRYLLPDMNGQHTELAQLLAH